MIYSSEAAFISFDGGINYYQIDMTPDIEKKLRSIPIGLKNGIDIKDKKEDNSVRIFNKLLTELEAIETEEFKIAKPQRTDGNKSYYLMPDGTELWADLSALNGMGILPDGTVIIGEGKDNPEYYYKLLVLKERYENIIEKITLRNLTSYVGDNIFHETTTDNIISILK